MEEKRPLYNSRITRNYLEYIRKYHPDVDEPELLAKAGMKRFEAADPAHWFSQDQVNRFHIAAVELTGDPEISLHAGRFFYSSEALGPVKEIGLSLITTTTAYLLVEKLIANFSRATKMKVRRFGKRTVEVRSSPLEGVVEKPYQCQNRRGALEAVARLFTGRFADIQHPECLHRGDSECRYIVSWIKTRAAVGRTLRNITIGLSLLITPLVFFLASLPTFAISLLSMSTLTMVLAAYTFRQEKNQLLESLKLRGNNAQEYLEEASFRYNSALLFQELGQAVSQITDAPRLLETSMGILGKRSSFERGILMAADLNKKRLEFAAGFGFEDSKNLKLEELSIDLNGTRHGPSVAFNELKTVFTSGQIQVEDQNIGNELDKLIGLMDSKSIIFTPLIYKDRALGILGVGDQGNPDILKKTEINLLEAFASQIAVGVANSVAFNRIRESEEKYRELVEEISDVIYSVNHRGEVTYISPLICSLTGHLPSEVVGRSLYDFVYRQDIPELRKNFQERYRTDSDDPIEFRLLSTMGDPVWVRTSFKAAKSYGRMKLIRGVLTDLTQLKDSEERHRKMEEALQRAQRMEALGTLAGGVAHDLNNILSGIVSYPELLLMELPDDSPLRESIETIKKSGQRAAATVQDLLSLARRGIVRSELLNLNRLITDYLESPEHGQLFRERPGLVVETELDEELLFLKGSPGHLSKVIMNLVTNAAEAISIAGTITIKTENRYIDVPLSGYETVKEGDYAALTVSDSGYGIEQKDLVRIFEPFYTRKVMGRSGTGLGLAVVWGTVKDHEGYIEVISDVGIGTTFTIYLPVSRQQQFGKIEKEDVDIFGQGELILVVDDIQQQRDIAALVLSRLGYRAVTVESGEEAVEYVRHNSPDLMILDMILPNGIDGLETYQQVLQIVPDQAVIIASGFSETDRVRKALRLGAKSYLRKPYTIESIGLAIQNALKTVTLKT